MDQGTVLIFNATIRVLKRDFFFLDNLKAFGLEAIKRLRFGFRRFTVEKYEKPDLAVTLVMFLNESHLTITTYPERKLAEVEVASCRMVSIDPLTDMVDKDKDLIMKTCFIARKNKEGFWIS